VGATRNALTLVHFSMETVRTGVGVAMRGLAGVCRGGLGVVWGSCSGKRAIPPGSAGRRGRLARPIAVWEGGRSGLFGVRVDVRVRVRGLATVTPALTASPWIRNGWVTPPSPDAARPHDAVARPAPVPGRSTDAVAPPVRPTRGHATAVTRAGRDQRRGATAVAQVSGARVRGETAVAPVLQAPKQRRDGSRCPSAPREPSPWSCRRLGPGTTHAVPTAAHDALRRITDADRTPPALSWPDAQGSRRAAARLEALTRQHDALLEGFRNPRPTLLHQRLSERRGRSR